MTTDLKIINSANKLCPDREKKHITVGYLINNLHHRYQSMIRPGILDAAKKRDCNTIGFIGKSINSPSIFENQENIIYKLACKKNIDGLIIFAGAIGNYIDSNELKFFCDQYKTQFPVVCISTPVKEIPSVWSDSSGMREIITHFIKIHNYKKIAFIQGPSKNPEAEIRYNIYKDVLAENNIPLDSNLIVKGDFIWFSGVEAVKTLIDKRKVKFDAIIASNDEMLIGAYRELIDRGISIPDDVALGGFDNIDETKIINPRITTVAQPLYEEGMKALNLLCDLIEDKTVAELHTFSSRLVVRESCGCKFENNLGKPENFHDRSNNAAYDKIISKEVRNIILESLIKDVEIQADVPKEFFECKDYIDIFLNQFIKDLEDSHSDFFLDEILKLTGCPQGIDFNLDFFKILIKKIYQYVSPYLISSPKLASRASDLYNSALYKLLDSLSRHNKNLLIKSRDYNWEILNFTKALSTTFDLATLRKVIIEFLHSLNISYCFIALYEDQVDPESIQISRSNVFLNYQIDNKEYNYKNIEVFNSVDFMKHISFNENNASDMLTFPLIIDNDQFGFIVLDYDSNKDSIIYETLQRHISSSLNQANLIKTVKKQSKNLFIQKGRLKNLETLRRVLGGFINCMSLVVEARDPYTAGHQVRVADLARSIAVEIGLPKNQIEGIRVAGILHDLGKIYIPTQILNKPGRLIDIEFDLIKMHPQISYNVLKSIDFTWPIAQIVLQHHERIDGSGYPSGLKGDEILIEAKIICVADVVEAMATHRPYRPAFGIDAALDEIINNRGKIYDPQVVDSCVKLFKEKGYQFKDFINTDIYSAFYAK